MCANWQMDMTEIEMLFDKLKLIPDQSEKIINNVLKQKVRLWQWRTFRKIFLYLQERIRSMRKQAVL